MLSTNQLQRQIAMLLQEPNQLMSILSESISVPAAADNFIDIFIRAKLANIFSASPPYANLEHEIDDLENRKDSAMWIQKEIRLKPHTRGFHLITDEIIRQLPELNSIAIGLLNILIKHTSASLSINENADPTVRKDFESFFNRVVPEGASHYRHDDEGNDDMPAHLKASLLGVSLNIPVTNGRLNLGVWQGIYLCEHRNHGDSRTLVLTLQGETVR